jgi:hypothetical protein
MIKIIATTIKSSNSEKPLLFFIPIPSVKVQFSRMSKTQLAHSPSTNCWASRQEQSWSQSAQLRKQMA